MPLKQGAVLCPDNRDLLHRDNTIIISVYQIPIIRATPCMYEARPGAIG